jgi:hypothetical protein
MSIKKMSSALFTALAVASGTFGLGLLSAITPLTQSAQAAYYQNCAFTAKIFQPTRIRPNPNTYTAEVGWLYPTQTVQFSTYAEGQPIWDANANGGKGAYDKLWFYLSGRGYVASAVVEGYPPTSPCPVSPPSGKFSLPKTIAEANPYFKLQFYHPTYNPGGPSGSSNCGPASLAMILAALKLEPPGLSIQASIDRASVDLMKRPKTAYGSTWSQLETGVRNGGRTPENVSSWGALDSALQAQNPVILNGYLNDNWRSQFPKRVGDGNVAHLNAVLGKTSNGNYLVADPMHTGGVVEMSRQKLTAFFTLGGQNGTPWGIAVK